MKNILLKGLVFLIAYMTPPNCSVIRDFSDPFGNRSDTYPFGEKNSDMLLQIGTSHVLVRCLLKLVRALKTVSFY